LLQTLLKLGKTKGQIKHLILDILALVHQIIQSQTVLALMMTITLVEIVGGMTLDILAMILDATIHTMILVVVTIVVVVTINFFPRTSR
jgi:hypothetical protein